MLHIFRISFICMIIKYYNKIVIISLEYITIENKNIE